MLKRFAVAVATVSPLVCIAADLAPAGTVGTLTVKVTVEGAGKEKPGPGEAGTGTQWSVKNSGEFTARLRARDASADDSAENQQKQEALSGIVSQTLTEKDEEVMNKWQDKEDACNGNEACENKVMMQKMSDPEFQRIQRKMQGAAPAAFAAGAQINMAPTMQLWGLHDEGSGARLQINLTETIYGVDVEGESETKPGTYIKYKDDLTCRLSGSPRVGAGSFHHDVLLRVDGKRQTYEVRIPGDGIFVELQSVCTLKQGRPSRSLTGHSWTDRAGPIRIPLMGRPKSESADSSRAEFNELLTFKGKVASASNPRLSGKRSFAADLRGYRIAAGPVKVTVEWQFVGGK